MDFTRDVEALNELIAFLGLVVTNVILCPRTVKFEIKLPNDLMTYKKVLSSERILKEALSSALNTIDFTYTRTGGCIYIDKKLDKFTPVAFSKFYDVLGKKQLRLVLGVDENGKKVYTNLSKAPHILIGGTTGSGKSELLHCFAASIAYSFPQTGAKLIILDPKGNEFSMYNNCINTEVITSVSKMYITMNNLVEEMQKRYRLLQSVGAKDIYSYPGEMNPIVVIIDELADLMLQFKDIEKPIVRIAQKARACGIHLIIGTQSPRKDIVTGLIKANIPTRIALKTTTSLESRIIMDRNGAEKLYGKGDMLFLGNGSFEPLRIQSAYMNETEKRILAEALRIEVPTKESCKPSLKSQVPNNESGVPLIHKKSKKKGYFDILKEFFNKIIV